MVDTPKELGYRETHEWVRNEGDGTVTVGITDYAQDSLGDIVYVELPELGDELDLGQEAGVVESVKAAADEVGDALFDTDDILTLGADAAVAAHHVLVDLGRQDRAVRRVLVADVRHCRNDHAVCHRIDNDRSSRRPCRRGLQRGIRRHGLNRDVHSAGEIQRRDDAHGARIDVSGTRHPPAGIRIEACANNG